MTKQKNPIIGLAFVVTSQQEMLEAKQQELDEKQKDINRLTELTVKLSVEQTEQKKEFAERIARLCEEDQQKLEAARNDARQEIELLSDEKDKLSLELSETQEKLKNANEMSLATHKAYDNVCMRYRELKAKTERTGWRKWTPDTEYDIGRYGSIPLVDGMYHYSADSTYSFYDNATKRSIPMAGKYNINSVNTPYQLDVTERGKFLVAPCESMVKDGATLVAVRINYTDDCILLDDFVLPEDENNQELL